MNPILEIEIPQYLLYVKLSDKQQAVYYRRGKVIPKKYIDFPFDRKGFLIHPKTRQRVIKNARSVGKPRRIRLSGNDLLSNAIKWTRATIVRELEGSYRRKLVGLHIPPLGMESFPLRVEWDIYCPIGKGDWDPDNLSFYWKYFCDTLRRLAIVPDDTIRYFTHAPGPRFFPVEREEDRKFVFRFYKDERLEITNHPFWQEEAV